MFIEPLVAYKSETFSTKCEIMIEILKLHAKLGKMWVFTCSEPVLVFYIVLFLINLKDLKKIITLEHRMFFEHSLQKDEGDGLILQSKIEEKKSNS